MRVPSFTLPHSSHIHSSIRDERLDVLVAHLSLLRECSDLVEAAIGLIRGGADERALLGFVRERDRQRRETQAAAQTEGRAR
jgi:hypothetical protein